jgi:GH15 family glucan-1,4-alpha-glucosidase
MRPRYAPIEDYGIIGDLHTVALVGKDGSIDFLCLPSFDSPSVFAALVDADRGGRFQIAPRLDDAVQRQLYLPDTNVLLTRFLSDSGLAEISDFMPVEDAGVAHNLVRRAKTVRGEICFAMRCEPRFDYARAPHTAERRGEREILFVGRSGPAELALRLRSSIPLQLADGAAVAEFTLRADESVWFVLEVVAAQAPSPSEGADYPTEAFKQTVNFWRAWIGRSTYKNRWREMVNRSALVLKLLTSAEHGSILASPTFGLPEHIGGVRNWDYRYTWIRDSSFTLYGLMRLGYTDEAAAFMRWMMARCQELEPDGALQIMYGIDGRRALIEETLPHLEGYMGSRPVRIGNAAHTHLQLDIYGELMDSVYLYDKYGSPIGHDEWMNVVRLVDWVCAHWREPDESIWEVRGGRREFLYSRVMCWVAVDRAIRLANRRSFPAPFSHWYEARDTIYRDIYERFWDPARRGFMQHPGAATFDAAALLMPLVRFVSPTDPRWIDTLRGIERELVSDSLVYRYRLGDGFHDGLTGQEGTFSMCSFWYVECLSRMGDVQKARFFFEKMLGYANHVGLYGEELGPRAQHLGNFPQAFTHLALISAAFDLDRRLSAAGHAG